ncbi:MAG: hypothetical protein ABFS45_03045 [Pseudomonadota bacterium]
MKRKRFTEEQSITILREGGIFSVRWNYYLASGTPPRHPPGDYKSLGPDAITP